MSVFQRYLLLQIPGWVLAAVIVCGLHRWFGLPLWGAGLLMLADILKDFLLYPALRRAYETHPSGGADPLIGQSAVARQPLNPSGYVFLRGELWHAEALPESLPVAAGARVRVASVRGLTLLVRAED